MSSRLLVLCYHNVEPTWCFPARQGAGARGLERQLRTVRRLANVVPLASALEDLTKGRPLPPRAVALTFDDGYRDNLTLALPMLERLGLPATFFLVPGLLSNTAMPWWEVVSWAVMNSSREQFEWDDRRWPLSSQAERKRTLSELQRSLKRRDRSDRDSVVESLAGELRPTGTRPSAESMFLNWDEARQLGSRGIAIGSHTCNHAILAQEDGEVQRRDLALSRRRLQDELSVAADVLAYPNGTAADYNDHTLVAAQEAGHSAALTTREGFNYQDTPPLELRRVVMYPERGLTELAMNLRYAIRDAA